MKTIRFSNSVLKHIALLTMIVDHIGNAFFPTNLFLRIIGRCSFVIFCFLLVEGALHTHSRLKYFLRLLLFAVVSIVPYSLFVYNVWLCTSQFNIFFVLSLSVAMISLFDYVKRFKLCTLLQIVVLLLFSFLGVLFCLDYFFLGFLLIATFYLLRDKKVLIMVSFFISSLLLYPLYYYLFEHQSLPISIAIGVIESCGFVALFFIMNSSGERGWQLPKLFYYAFYPLHFLIIWLIKTYFI